MHVRPSFSVLLVFAGALSADAQVVPASSQPPILIISVSGEGEASARPDRAVVTIGVESRAATAAAAANDNARRQRAILDTLRALGYASEQLTTSNYSVQPEMQYDEQGRRARVVGYVVSNTVRVEIRQLDWIARTIDAALAKGANQVHGIGFHLSDPGPSRREAIASAMARARTDAEALARAAGGSLGPILELSTNPLPIQPMMFRQVVSAMARAEAGVATPIEAGEEVVRATVNVRWAFVPGGTR